MFNVKENQYFVYIIGNDINETPPYLNCYVGVTNNIKKRWDYHKKSDYTVGKYIQKHNLKYEKNMKIIYFGDNISCYELEKTLRPNPYIGLNESVGGNGGYTKYTKIRNEKISKKLKGRKVYWADKISKTKKLKKSLVGESNPKSKNWKLIEPTGKVHFVNGNLQNFCKEKNILWSTLIRYKCQIVPDINIGYGGFREKYENHKFYRKNTVGWSLYDISGE